jgi:hypothetical protein
MPTISLFIQIIVLAFVALRLLAKQAAGFLAA